MIEISKCPICRSTHLTPNAQRAVSKPYMNFDADGIGLTMGTVVSYALCQVCGAYIQTPRMTDEEVQKYYRDGLYRAWLNISQEKMDDDEHRRAENDADIVMKRIGDIESHLDVGASRGYFLNEVGAERRIAIEANVGWVTTKNVEVYRTLEEYLPQSDYKSQLVSAIHVLEHTTDPLRFLQDMSCASEEWLMIEVPSDKSPGGWARLPHLFHFPTWTLHYMFDEIGWKIETTLFTPHTLVLAKRK
jgi:hypothetical protein